MKTIRVGYGRLYNARGFSLLGRNEVLLRFSFGIVAVEAYIGPNLRHLIASFKASLVPKDPKAHRRVLRAREYEFPLPEKFPADFYTELVATQAIEVDEALAAAFHGRDEAARAEMLCKVEERKSSLTTALDYVAGVLGLRLHYSLVRTPITEQCYAYRDKGAPYAFSWNLRLKTIGTHEWDVSDEGLTATKSKLPQLLTRWTWEKAAEVLAWLLRAWSAEDPVLEFVSLFIPLECVIPGLPSAGKNAWDQKRSAVLAIIEKEATAEERNELSKFVTDLRPPPPSLALRFEKWAAGAKQPGWKQDVAAFTQFHKMRNLLVHAGKKGVKSRVTVAADDVRTLEDIATRYVSLALFGDADVYQIPKRAVRL